MQLASERQTDVAKLLEFLSTIIKYKILDSAASVLLPNFALLLQKSYDRALALQSQEVRRDRNRHILPLMISQKFHEAEIKYGQKNVPWKVLLDLLFVHKHTVVDWPAGVPAVGPDFNVKRLNADELHALTVPFLKEQMEQDYNLEAPAEEEEDHFVPVPASSFYLKHWTADQLQLLREADPKAFDIPLVVNTLHHSLRLVSDSQAFVKALPPTMHRKGPDQEAAPCLPPPPAEAQPHPCTRGHAAPNTRNARRPPPTSEYSPLPPSSLPDNSPCSSPPRATHDPALVARHLQHGASHSRSPTLHSHHCPCHRSQKHRREYPGDGSENDAGPSQGRSHRSVVEYVYRSPHTRDTTIHLMMKMATPIIVISATECSLMIPPSPFISTMDTDPYLSASTTPHGRCCRVARQ